MMRAKIFWKMFEPSFPSLCACACSTYSFWVINAQQKPFWNFFGPWCHPRCFNLLGYMSLLRFRANAFECPNLFYLPLFSGNKLLEMFQHHGMHHVCLFCFFYMSWTSKQTWNDVSEVCCNSTVNMSLNLNSQATFGSRWLVCPARFSHPFSYSLLCRHRKLLILRSWRQSALPFCNNRCPTTPPTGSCSLKELWERARPYYSSSVVLAIWTAFSSCGAD